VKIEPIVHPGEILAEELEGRRATGAFAARSLGFPMIGIGRFCRNMVVAENTAST
jgi:hypothetical protein